MSEEQGLRYETYTAKSLAVFGDRDKYDGIMRTLSARWNEKMRCGPGWMVNREYEDRLKQLIESMGQVEEKEEPVVEESQKKTKKGKKNKDTVVVQQEVKEDVVEEPVKPKKERKTKKVKDEEVIESTTVVPESVPDESSKTKKERKTKKEDPVFINGDEIEASAHTKRKYTRKAKPDQVPMPVPAPMPVFPAPIVPLTTAPVPTYEEEKDSDDSHSHSSHSSEESSDRSSDSASELSDSASDSHASSSESEYDRLASRHGDYKEEKVDHRRIINPSEKLHKKSKETFINKYVNSDDEVDPEESKRILEKYQKLFQFFKSFSEKPEKFDHDRVRKMRE